MLEVSIDHMPGHAGLLSGDGCILAYHGMVVDKSGTLMPCCQYAAGRQPPRVSWDQPRQYFEIIRQAMHQDWQEGRSHGACAKCHKEESLGAQSLREHANRWYGRRYQLEEHAAVYHLELRLGNVCNLKCIMCWPGASSAVAWERHHHQDQFRTLGLAQVTLDRMPEWWQEPQFKSWFSTVVRDVRHLHFTGGEPFLIPEVVDFVQMAVSLSPGLEIGFNTNLTVWPERLMQILGAAGRLSFAVSMEGVDTMNDYVRFPSDWKHIHENFMKMLDHFPRAQITINHTIQHASVYSLPALVQYSHEHGIPINFNMVQGHPDLSWNSVPPKDLATMADWIDKTSWLSTPNRNLLQNLVSQTKFDLALYQQFREYIAVLDRIRGTSWDDTFNPSTVDIA